MIEFIFCIWPSYRLWQLLFSPKGWFMIAQQIFIHFFSHKICTGGLFMHLLFEDLAFWILLMLSHLSWMLSLSKLDSLSLSDTLFIRVISCHLHRKSMAFAFHIKNYVLFLVLWRLWKCTLLLWRTFPWKSLNLNLLPKNALIILTISIQSIYLRGFCKGKKKNKPSSELKFIFHDKTQWKGRLLLMCKISCMSLLEFWNHVSIT